MLWHDQSWRGIQLLDKKLPVIIPLGSCEQHGRHLPLFVDTIQVTTIAERIEQELSDRVVLMPTLWLGCSHHHMDYPGTISVKPSLYEQVVKSVAISVLSAGFTRLFFLNGHGGNLTPAASALTELADERDDADAAHIVLASWWQLCAKTMRPERHGMETPQLTHACEYETSIMLAVRPDLVQLEHVADGEVSDSRPWTRQRWSPALRGFTRFHRMTRSGHLGDPRPATAAKGHSIVDAVVGELTAFLNDFATWPATSTHGPKQ